MSFYNTNKGLMILKTLYNDFHIKEILEFILWFSLLIIIYTWWILIKEHIAYLKHLDYINSIKEMTDEWYELKANI